LDCETPGGEKVENGKENLLEILFYFVENNFSKRILIEIIWV